MRNTYEDQPARLPATSPDGASTGAAPQTWCHWHGGYTDTGRLITAEEQNSGPGFHRYACAPCREKHRLPLWGADSAGA